MDYRTTKMRYAGGGRIKYLVYKSPQPLRTGQTQQRTRVHRLYFPESAFHISIEGPKTLKKRTGKPVYGVAVHYRYHLHGTTAQRNQTRYEIPARNSDRTKIVELPRDAKNIHMTDHPPKGPKMAVA